MSGQETILIGGDLHVTPKQVRTPVRPCDQFVHVERHVGLEYLPLIYPTG